MRLYDRRKLSRFVDRKTDGKTESRDAIVWDVNSAEGYCRVKIQGSDELIVAHLPTNWSWIPQWCKKGNAVCIRHKKGVRGYVEVIGNGRARPTAVPGGSVEYVVIPSDGVVSGMVVTVESSISLAVSAGTYRCNGTLYGFPGATDSPVMGEDNQVMGEDIIILGGVQGAIYVTPIPSYEYARYDIIYIDCATGVVNSISGASVKITTLGCDAPVIPSTPANAIRLAYVLLIGNNKNMVDSDINKEWAAPFYSYFKWSWGQGRIDDDEDNPLVDAIILDCWSQYYLHLYGEVTFAVGVSYGDLWAPDDRSIELHGSPGIGTPEYHPVQGFCTSQWTTVSIEDDPMKWLFLPFDYFEILPSLGPPEYNTIIAISIRREDGSMINYTENMYRIEDPTFDFGGDLDLLGDLWG